MTAADRYDARQLEFSWDNPSRESAPPHTAPSAPPQTPQPAPGDDEVHAAAQRWHREITRSMGKTVRLYIHDNRTSMIHARTSADGQLLTLRMHRMFLTAPDEVAHALLHWLKHPKSKRAGQAINAYIRANRPQSAERAGPSSETLRTKGRHFDLAELYAEVNAAHFGGSVNAPISWGRMPARRPKRSIKLGSHSMRTGIIHIHPYLDREWVPRFLVRYIVFHEMLHAHLGVRKTASGRRSVHSPEFNAAEKAYPDFARAEAWLEKNTGRLMRGSKAPRQ